jgi:shikimate dehydrogenase
VDLEGLFAGAPDGARFFGVAGHPVAHSLSPAMHAAALARFEIPAVYRALPVPPEEWDAFAAAAAALPLDGFNVTLPHKERVKQKAEFAFGDDLARLSGACNAVACRGAAWTGHNTDGPGFLEDLQSIGIATKNKSVVLLGAGGTARTILFALAFSPEAPARVTLVNRSAEKARLQAEYFSKTQPKVPALSQTLRAAAASERDAGNAFIEADLIINATAAGLAPEPFPWDLSGLRPGAAAYDVIYHRTTEFMAAAQKAGVRVSGGLGMLVNQGALSFEIWFGRRDPGELRRVMRAAAEKALKEKPNP